MVFVSERCTWKKTQVSTQPDMGIVDFNTGPEVPLIEIVTEPDMTSPEEARRFLRELHRVLEYSGSARGEGYHAGRCEHLHRGR
jgi:Asp-tRNA(Asn)/Glu-tRNA(Gln) amidotransferase B subunit